MIVNFEKISHSLYLKFVLNIYVKNEQLLLFAIIFLIVSKHFIKHIVG